MIKAWPELGRIAGFGINGLVATGCHYTILSILLASGLVPYAGLASGIGAVFGIAVSFIGNRFLVFRSTEKLGRTLPRFLLLYGIIALFHATFLFLWTDLAGLAKGTGFLAATAIATILSYLGNRYLVFGVTDSPAGQA